MSEISGPRLPRSEGEEMSSDPVERVRKAAIGQFAVDLLDLHLVLVEVGSLRAENARLRTALVAHNDMLRSCCQVAERGGKDTNWTALLARIGEVLQDGHAIMCSRPGGDRSRPGPLTGRS